MKVFARASWESGLTELKVRATVRSSLRDSQSFDLFDGGALSKTAGEYRASISNLKVGQYKGYISIEAGRRVHG